MKLVAVFAALALAAAPAVAIRSFSGWNCDGNSSPEYECDGSCQSFVRPEIRHSIKVRRSSAPCVVRIILVAKRSTSNRLAIPAKITASQCMKTKVAPIMAARAGNTTLLVARTGSVR